MLSQRASVAIGAIVGIVVIDLPVLIVWAAAGFAPASDLAPTLVTSTVLAALGGSLFGGLLRRELTRSPTDYRSRRLIVSGLASAIVFAALVLILHPVPDVSHIALFGLASIGVNLLTYWILSRVWPQGTDGQ